MPPRLASLVTRLTSGCVTPTKRRAGTRAAWFRSWWRTPSGSGPPPIELSLEQRAGRARIEVADAGVRDGRRPPEGWSQRIIADLAARWGVRGNDAHVWFELPVREPGDGEGRLG